MTADDVRIRGAADAHDIAAVLAVLARVQAVPAPVPTGTAWRAGRRTALARTARTPRR